MPTATQPPAPPTEEAYQYARLRVPIFDVEVPTVAAGRVIYFPLKSLCDVLGVGPQKQIDRLRTLDWSAPAIRLLPVPTIKGTRDAFCIRRREAARWLAEIDTAHVRAEVRDRLQQFQTMLFDIADRWLFGDQSAVVADRQPRPVTGVLHLGDCPRCGLALAMAIGSDGRPHLEAEEV